MNDAAERYSPEIAEAFQPTETDLPATKKSCAVLERFADQNPIQIVTMTVRALKANIHGSIVANSTGVVMRSLSAAYFRTCPPASLSTLPPPQMRLTGE